MTDTLREVITTYPESLAAREAAELLRRQDQDPPSLTVVAEPRRLWPPDHMLIAISVNVAAADAVDPSPRITLVSIECNDAFAGAPPAAGDRGANQTTCDAEDVAGAEYGTDDRAFELRAERRGDGPGRTYAITYSATDAAGNTATAQTAVTVSHDQR